MCLLALHTVFLGLGNFIDDRPVATSEVDGLRQRLGPLLDLMCNGDLGLVPQIEAALDGIRSIIR